MQSRSSVKSDKQQDEDQASNDLCVDASLWVRFLTKEEGSEEACRLFKLWFASCDFFIAPSLLIFELASVLRKKVIHHLLPESAIGEIFAHFYEHPILLYQSEDFMKLTMKFAEAMKTPMPYDASYVALAAWKKVPFYTADVALYEKGKELYPHCHLV